MARRHGLTGINVMLALAVGTAGAGCSGGEEGWTQWSGSGASGHWYKADSKRTDWESAQVAASSGGHYLATITSSSEEQFIIETFLTGASAQQVFWIGGTCKADGKTWKWVTGEAFSYTNWKGWEPSGDGDYLCINWNAVRGDPLGEWNDAPNTGTTDYDDGTNDGPYAALLESDSKP